MKQKKTDKNTQAKPADELRNRAEVIAQENSILSPEHSEELTPKEVRQTLHDLRVHQIELEIQNEELRLSQESLEAARRRYFDLYDMAPTGYFTISEKGLILETNLTAATLLGVRRVDLVGQPLSRFIAKEEQDIYYNHRKLLFETGAPQVCEIRMLPAAAPCWVRIDAVAAQEADGAPSCRATMINITDRK
ncbi:MAG: PAS domain-containing protein, partial [Syntrophus sp. (in: bacteria)]